MKYTTYERFIMREFGVIADDLTVRLQMSTDEFISTLDNLYNWNFNLDCSESGQTTNMMKMIMIMHWMIDNKDMILLRLL